MATIQAFDHALSALRAASQRSALASYAGDAVGQVDELRIAGRHLQSVAALLRPHLDGNVAARHAWYAVNEAAGTVSQVTSQRILSTAPFQSPLPIGHGWTIDLTISEAVRHLGRA